MNNIAFRHPCDDLKCNRTMNTVVRSERRSVCVWSDGNYDVQRFHPEFVLKRLEMRLFGMPVACYSPG